MKRLIYLVVVMVAIGLSLPIVASAATSHNDDGTFTTSIEDKELANQVITITVFKGKEHTADNLMYIDEFSADENGSFEITYETKEPVSESKEPFTIEIMSEGTTVEQKIIPGGADETDGDNGDGENEQPENGDSNGDNEGNGNTDENNGDNTDNTDNEDGASDTDQPDNTGSNDNTDTGGSATDGDTHEAPADENNDDENEENVAANVSNGDNNAGNNAEKNGEKLPDTASAFGNWLMYGGILLLAGLVIAIVVVSRRRFS